MEIRFCEGGFSEGKGFQPKAIAFFWRLVTLGVGSTSGGLMFRKRLLAGEVIEKPRSQRIDV